VIQNIIRIVRFFVVPFSPQLLIAGHSDQFGRNAASAARQTNASMN